MVDTQDDDLDETIIRNALVQASLVFPDAPPHKIREIVMAQLEDRDPFVVALAIERLLKGAGSIA